MADTEKVLFSRGPRATMPSNKVPGTIYITTDTGEMFVDDTDTSRIQVGPSPADVRSLGVSGASVGQVPTVKAVNENGVPTAWEAVDKWEAAVDSDAIESLAECDIITPAYQDGVFYTDTDGAIYVL